MLELLNDQKIIEIHPVEQFFRVNWRIDTRCNYDCSYCAEEWHSKTSPIRSISDLQLSWIKIYTLAHTRNLPIQLTIMGGEPTTNHNLVPFIEWLFLNYKNNLGKVGLSTNGSAPLKIYIKLMQYLQFISFSVHSEFFNERSFFSKILALRKSIPINTNKQIDVTIMDEHWNRSRFDVYEKILQKNHINYKFISINWNLATRTIPIINSKNQLIK